MSHYQDESLDNPLLVGHSGGVGVSYQVARHTLLAANQSVSYQPYYSMGLFPGLYDLPLGQTEPTNSSRATSFQNRLSTTSGVELTQTLTRKLSLGFNYGYWQTKSPYNVWDVSSRTAGGQVVYGIGRGLALRLQRLALRRRGHVAGERLHRPELRRRPRFQSIAVVVEKGHPDIQHRHDGYRLPESDTFRSRGKCQAESRDRPDVERRVSL